MKKIFLILTLSTVIVSCSTISRSSWTGAGLGAVTGAALGHSLNRENKGKGALVGAALSGLIGAGIGYLTHKGLEKRDERVRKETLFNLDKYDVSYPSELQPTERKGGREIFIITDDNDFLKRINKQ
ncbi:MAG: glycine zipper domain-containing protein [Bacteriovoracaceae bacterium]|jgi:uncharacterized protein YcfJ|nr:glycine zipper domain-containing protein [Bacteriovoracaceae bacterium]